MTALIPQIVTSTDTFGNLISKVNQLLVIANNQAVTTQSNTAVGNAAITDTFSANNLIASLGSVKAGQGSSNVIVTGTNILIQTSATANTIINGTGTLINGAVFYTDTLMKIGNTYSTSMNVHSDQGVFVSNVLVGNSIIARDRIYADLVDTNRLLSDSALFGDIEANVVADRYGLQVYAAPGGVNPYVVNSRMTSTDLYIENVWANTIHANVAYIRTFAGGGNFDLPVLFQANTWFKGQNNVFDYGMASTGNVDIYGADLRFSHHFYGNTTTNQTLSSNAVYLYNASSGGVVFSRNVVQVSSVVKGTGETGEQLALSNGSFAFSSYNSLAGPYPATATLTTVLTSNTQETNIYSSNTIINGMLSFPGSTSGSVMLVANAVAGSVKYTLPTTIPTQSATSKQYLTADGAGKMFWATAFSSSASNDIDVRDLHVFRSASVGSAVNPSTTNGDLRVQGNITAYYSSDQRLKENVANITDALAKVMLLNGVTFDWVDSWIEEQGGVDGTYVRKNDVGIIAQDLEGVLPQLVTERDDGYKAVKYDRVVALLIEAIKELKAEVDELKGLKK